MWGEQGIEYCRVIPTHSTEPIFLLHLPTDPLASLLSPAHADHTLNDLSHTSVSHRLQVPAHTRPHHRGVHYGPT
jgi:hypothetical protein